MRLAWAACALVLIGCGGSDTEPREPDLRGGGERSGRTDGGASSNAKLTANECGAMLDHIVDIGHAEQKRTLAPEAVPTDEQIAEIKKKQRGTFTKQCLGLPRATFHCAMGASTPGELKTCEKPP